MTIQSDVQGLLGHWRTQAAYYNAAEARLEDQSGCGNHLYLEAGTPDFTQVAAGHTGFKMHGDCYFLAKDRLGKPVSFLPPRHTVMVALNANTNGTDQVLPFYECYRSFANFGDPVWEVPTDTAEGTAARARRMRLINGNMTYGDPTFGVTPNIPYTEGAWNIFVAVWEPTGGFRKAGVNPLNGGDLVDDGGAPSQQRHLLAYDEFRIGLLTGLATLTTSGGESCTSLQVAAWAGDVTNEPEFTTMMTALIADPSA